MPSLLAKSHWKMTLPVSRGRGHSQEQIEAARVEAPRRPALRHITCRHPAAPDDPDLLSIIWDSKSFTQSTRCPGRARRQTVTLSIYAYIKGLSEKPYGIASSGLLVMVMS